MAGVVGGTVVAVGWGEGRFAMQLGLGRNPAAAGRGGGFGKEGGRDGAGRRGCQAASCRVMVLCK